MLDNINTREACRLLQSVDLDPIEKQHIDGLLCDYGYLGAIHYLKPLGVIREERDQIQADRHRAILEGFSRTYPITDDSTAEEIASFNRTLPDGIFLYKDDGHLRIGMHLNKPIGR